MKKSAILDLAHLHWPSFLDSRAKALKLNSWLRGEQYDADPFDTDSRYHGQVFYPRQDNAGRSAEYDNLASLTPSNYAGLVVTTLAQTALIEGIRMPKSQENLESWKTMQRNRWLMKQSAIHRCAIGLSTAYGVAMPGEDPLTGARMARMTGKSPIRMAAFYDADDDEWARLAIEAEPYELQGSNGAVVETGWRVALYDEAAKHYLIVKGDGHDRQHWEYVSHETHPLGVTPVARCVNRLDLDGNATGEIEPVLPMLRRIDQDTFDRLIVQRFGAWKVRYIAGMAKPTSQEAANLQAIKLRVEDLLISGDPNTKFGTLDASDLKGFIDAHDADLRMLSAVTQMPPHHLLGLSSNLQAEALAAAESALQRKSTDFKLNASEFHEQMARMGAVIQGNLEEANAVDLQVRWADTESRSLTQAADALGKLAVQLNVPVEMLWEKIPGWTDSDVERARDLVESGDAIDQIIAALNQGEQEAQEPAEPASGDGQ